MNGKKYEELGFELCVRLFKTSHERGANVAGHSTTALFSKKFNNLFVKNFPRPNFSETELTVSLLITFGPHDASSKKIESDQNFCFFAHRRYSSLSACS